MPDGLDVTSGPGSANVTVEIDDIEQVIGMPADIGRMRTGDQIFSGAAGTMQYR